MSAGGHRFGFVGVAGRPNAGKSTLVNALVGEKVAITAYQAQTTRTSIQGVLTTSEAQIVFVDTPGIHKSDNYFNKRMMETVRTGLSERDLLLYVADSSKPVATEDEHALSALPNETSALLVLNKTDRLSDKRMLLPLTARYSELFPFAETIPVSALKGDGVQQLKRVIAGRLPEGPALFPDDYLTDQPVRFMAAEIIRERILRAVRQEVPHAVAILIEKWEETPGLIRISATIHVERQGQKAILVGEKGGMLKKIGTEARQALERLLERKVYLSLFVKVQPNWREDPSFVNTVDWRAMIGSEDK